MKFKGARRIRKLWRRWSKSQQSVTRRLRAFAVTRLTAGKEGRRALLASAKVGSVAIAETEGGLKFLFSTADRGVGRPTFLDSEPFDSHLVGLALDILKKPSVDLLVNVGANIGTVSIPAVASNLAKRAIAVEPEPFNYSLLECNIGLNGLKGEIIPLRVALSDGSTDEVLLSVNASNFGDHRATLPTEGMDYRGNELIAVPCQTLDEIIPNNFNDSTLIVMDTQGFEGKILSKGSAAIEKGIPLVMELDPPLLDKNGDLELFVGILLSSPHNWVCDLRSPEKVLPLNRETLSALVAGLKRTSTDTDVLVSS